MPTRTLAPSMRMETHWGRSIRCYANCPAKVDALFRAAAARAPDADALVEGARRHSYRTLNDSAYACAAGLARCGAKPGDRVAVFLGNCPEAVIAVLGIARLGAVVVPVGSRLRRPELDHVIGDARPVALIYDAEFAAELPPPGQAPGIRIRVGGADDASGFAALLREGGTPPACPASEDDLCDQDDVVEAAMVGQPDSILCERSVAFVYARTPLLEQQAREFCAARLADYKVPDWAVVSDEPLPRNANGKIQKDQLRYQAEAHVIGAARPGGLSR